MPQTFDVIHKNQDKINNEAYQLQNLANAFLITGNTLMSEQLEWIAHSIKDSAKNMAKAYDDDIAQQFRASMQQMGETLSAFAQKP